METNEIKVITAEEYNKMQNVCYENPSDDNLLEDIEDYYEELEFNSIEEIEQLVLNAAKIPVYTKDMFKYSAERMKENITEFGYDNYYMDDPYNQIAGLELIDEFMEKFNAMQHYYISDKLVAYLDLSSEVREYCLKELAEA